VAVDSDLLVQLALGVGSSVVTGSAVWLGQRLRSAGRTRALRGFLGLVGPYRQACRIVVGRNPFSPRMIHQFDVAAMLEVSALVRATGVQPEVLSAEEAADGADQVEFCVAGPLANSRTEAHLRRYLPGLTVAPAARDSPDSLALLVGGRRFRQDHREAEYVALARVCRPGRPHLFILSGQTAITNRAAAVFLAEQRPQLRRRYGDDDTFVLILRVRDTAAYRHREVEEVADVTASALVRPQPLRAADDADAADSGQPRDAGDVLT
jgi:hypothetical protein